MSSPAPFARLPGHPERQSHAQRLSGTSVPGLFQADPQRADDFCAEALGLRLDYSRQWLDRPAREALLALAAAADLHGAARALLEGQSLNITELRPALHSLLRARSAPRGLEAEFAEVAATRLRMQACCEQLHGGNWIGFSGKAITDVVNLGIGGSDLGPRLIVEALGSYRGAVDCHHVANVDPADLQDTLLELDPATTLFIVCSKSFQTRETLTNAQVARNWLLTAGAGEEQLLRHFLAITTNLEAAEAFGLPADNCLPIWDWVGGRYSVWSAIGLSSAIAIGWDAFSELLDGAAAMDQHFVEAPAASNLPMLLSLLETWCCQYLGAENLAVLPYDHGLRHLPDYLQQLTMESNGKGVDAEGRPLSWDSAPVLWGAAGTLGQHSFHQLLHQGTRLCPADFILPLRTRTGMHEQHRLLVANGIAQSRALMVGRSAEEARSELLQRGLQKQRADALAPHLAMPGSRPHNVISFDAVTPWRLGALLALYEHRTFCSAQLWGINAFDQWGVELGKQIADSLLEEMSGPTDPNQPGAGRVDLDPASRALLEAWRRAQTPG
jgi:glucose-6-phosphate isomerase